MAPYAGGGLSGTSAPSKPPHSPPLPHQPPLPPPLPPPPFITLIPPEMLQNAFILLAVVLMGTCVCCITLYVLRDRVYLERLSSGRTSCRINAVCCVPVLCYNAWSIYFLPCGRAYVAWLIDTLILAPLRRICCDRCCRHADRAFPPKPSSIGVWDGKSIEDGDIEWVRAQSLLASGGGVAGQKVKVTMGAQKPRVKLFEDDVCPSDVGQGSVGNCWLVAAIAAAAEHPGLVQSLFITKRASLRGKYTVRLFDWSARRWVHVSVDDRLPATRANNAKASGKGSAPASALFAQPQGREVWVCILEKAFAKLCGSYGALDGGQTAWALNALTGDPVFILRKHKQTESKPTSDVEAPSPSAIDDGGRAANTRRHAEDTDVDVSSSQDSTPRGSAAPSAGPSPSSADTHSADAALPAAPSRPPASFGWERIDMRPKLGGEKSGSQDKRAVEFVGRSPAESYDSQQTFFVLRRYVQQKALMGASFGSYGGGGGEGLNGEDMGPKGLVSGHAYTVIDVKAFSKTCDAHGGPLRLVQLRNPWGKGEWEGAWSDGSEEWKKHRAIRKMLRPKQVDDGAFWMDWNDFVRIFEQIDICSRRSGIADLHLDLNEADGCAANLLGPLKGCAAGCAAFWCCCQGCRALYGTNGGGDEATIGIAEPSRRGRALAADAKHAYDDKVVQRVGKLLEETAKTVQQL
jgi:hypothetical protein